MPEMADVPFKSKLDNWPARLGTSIGQTGSKFRLSKDMNKGNNIRRAALNPFLTPDRSVPPTSQDASRWPRYLNPDKTLKVSYRMHFIDLPVEILPEVLNFVVKPQHLASACLVNRTFQTFAVPRLYARISIYSWHKEGKSKVVKLFDTLSRCTYLALLVRRLEIRDFPKAVTLLDSDLLQHVLRGIRNCIGLTSCIWTRDGSLNSEILEAFHHCPDLRELEFNGHNDGNYDPKLLLGITSLRRISIIMPSAMVLSQLEPWFSKMSDRLRNLTLICKSSRIVTDSVLETLAPSLVNLDHLHITGCPKVTHRGVWALVSTNQSGLKGLGLEGVSLAFDMNLFAKQCVASGSLTQLRAITLTVHHQIPLKAWVQGVIDLLSLSKIELFQIYSTGAFFESPLTDELWNHLVTTHSQSLIRFSVHRMMIDMDAIHKICVSCPNLEQLFVVVDPNYLDELADSLAHARKMRTIHVNFPLEAFIDTVPILRPDQALEVLNKCSPTVVQFGCNAKVWQVVRKIVRASGELRTEAALAPYENPDVPEQFLVVRT